MTTVPQDYRDRMIRRFGFTLSRATVCPRVVAGKRCYRWTARARYDSATKTHRYCPCEAYQPLFDHARIWIDPATGQHILTAEPYGVDQALVRAFRAREGRELGLALVVTRQSYWYKGTTLLLIKRVV